MAPNKCAYFMCNTTSDRKSMFRFPTRDSRRLQVWLSNCGNMNITHLSHNELRNKYICLDHFKEEFVRNKGGKRTRLTKKALPKHYQQEEIISHSPIPSTSRDNSPEIKMELPKKVYPVVYRSNVEIEEPSGLLVQVDSPKERKISSDEDTINTNSLAHKRKSERLKNKKIDFFEMPLSNAEKCKNYRNRKKKAAPPKTKTPKTSAERCRMYRLRKIELAQGSQLSANEVLNSPIDSIPYHTDIAVENKYLKERPKKPHDHVLRRLRDDQYSCDVCHETFTRVSKQKNVTVGPDATPGPAIKQEKEAIDDNVECREYYKQGAPESVNGICGIKIESVKTEATHPEQSVNDLPVPPAAIKQEYEIKTEYIEIEVKKEIIEESFMEEVE